MRRIRTQKRDGVLSIELYRPEKLNALDADMAEECVLALEEIEQPASGIRAVLLTGAGRSFCAGADKGALARLGTEKDIRRHAEGLRRVFQLLADASVPVITGVQGHALGAGCGLVTASTVVFAAEDAQFGYPEMASGILPALVTPLLVARVGSHRARGLLLSSARFSAPQGMAMGLVTALVAGSPVEVASELAHRLAAQEDSALAGLYALLEHADRRTLGEALDYAVELNVAGKLVTL